MIIKGFDLVMRAYTWWYHVFGSIAFVESLSIYYKAVTVDHFAW